MTTLGDEARRLADGNVEMGEDSDAIFPKTAEKSMDEVVKERDKIEKMQTTVLVWMKVNKCCNNYNMLLWTNWDWFCCNMHALGTVVIIFSPNYIYALPKTSNDLNKAVEKSRSCSNDEVLRSSKRLAALSAGTPESYARRTR